MNKSFRLTQKIFLKEHIILVAMSSSSSVSSTSSSSSSEVELVQRPDNGRKRKNGEYVAAGRVTCFDKKNFYPLTPALIVFDRFGGRLSGKNIKK